MTPKPPSSINHVIVFTDGACSGNPGPGGWGIIIATPEGQVTELGGGSRSTTNNRMELMAAIASLAHLEKIPVDIPIEIYTDSVYVIRGITQWSWAWRKNNWKTSEGKDVSNPDLWKKLISLIAKHREKSPIYWKYVRGHSGIPGNDRVDEIAVAFAAGHKPKLYHGPLLKYDIPLYDLPENTDPPEYKSKILPKQAAYSYLSLIGNIPMRHKDWADCERRVKGRPGAKFKKAMSANEENAILQAWGYKLSDLKKNA